MRFFANRFHNFCYRAYLRRTRLGILEPEWIDIRSEEYYKWEQSQIANGIGVDDDTE